MAKRTPKNSTSTHNGDGTNDPALDYRHHHARRLNNPTAGNAPEGKVQPTERKVNAYDPHRPPTLRYDATGRSDAVTDRMASLLAKAQAAPSEAGSGSLSPSEAAELAEALRQGQPWLEWAGKREHSAFVVDAPAIHVHERVSSRALLRIATRRDVQRSLFGESDLSYSQSVQFYRHSVRWSNRLILGDNRAVMASLATREDLAGKVQCIYIDPPYGIDFKSNFQSEVGNKNGTISNNDGSLSREMETVKAYRDTWSLGTHTFLEYLRGLFQVARELLSGSGSVFIQISEENVHQVRSLMDDVFARNNFCSMIPFTKTTGFTPKLLSSVTDYLLWFAKDKSRVKYRKLFDGRSPIEDPSERYVCVETPEGRVIDLSVSQKVGDKPLPHGRILKLRDVTSQGAGESTPVAFVGRDFSPPPNRHWSIRKENIPRFLKSGYAHNIGKSLMWKCPLDIFPYTPINNIWTDIQAMGFGEEKLYVVQTPSAVIARCMLMTTDPGDLVLDPTCGSGTTAAVAEQWGRRWISIDTSRVAIAIARQRIITSRFDYFKLRDETNGPTGGFYYKTVPHVTLKSIAQNAGLDSIFARHDPILAERLALLNATLATVTPEVRARLQSKLAAKRKAKSKDDPVTDADERR